jgi:polysaccharide export outer membrane protein
MGPTLTKRAWLGSLAAALLLAPALGAQQTTPPSGQQKPIPGVAQQMLSNLTPQQIQARIEASGLTPAEIRDRLQRAGYDPSLLDAYLGGTTTTTPAQDATFLQELQSIGVLRVAGLPGVSDTLGLQGLTGLDTLLQRTDTSRMRGMPDTTLHVFGMDVFSRRTTQFNPVLTGPVGPDYRLGPGDQLNLILTGDVELAYQLDVTREGYVVIPDVGQVFVNGLTLGQLRDELYTRLGKVYSGVKRTPNATTHFDVSLGALRTNQVYVVGDVQRPGAYQVSSVATILEALYDAGGPAESGSFRSVIVRRGGKEVGAFDLYRYLTAGETPVELRLEEGDVVFVPPVGIQVALRGEVRHPALYELLPGEGLPDLVRYAGGLKPSASQSRIQVDRILPVGQRQNGRDREVLDVDYDSVAAGAEAFPLHAGDQVEVFPVLDQRRGWVQIDGAVYRPGTYELQPQSTVASLVARAGGPLPDVLAPILHVSRLDTLNGTRSLIRGSLAAAGSLPLEEFDEVTLFGQDSLLVPDSVSVYGLVQQPGTYPLAKGMNAEDLILDAGGFAQSADPRQAEVVRTRGLSGTNGHVSRSTYVALSGRIPYADSSAVDSLPPLVAENGQDPPPVPAATVQLQPGDEVFVRQLPNYRPPRRVTVTGEVREPGIYVLQSMDERLASLVRRAGGLTPQAFADGIRLIRDSTIVAVDVQNAMKHPGSVDDPVLADGDSVVVPIYDPTVLVRGAVQFSTRVTYRNGMDLGDVLSAAGGLTSDADGGRTSVQYANGQRATLKHFLGITYSTPSIQPGSSVFVPRKPQGGPGFDWNSALTRILAVTSTMATLYIAIHR